MTKDRKEDKTGEKKAGFNTGRKRMLLIGIPILLLGALILVGYNSFQKNDTRRRSSAFLSTKVYKLPHSKEIWGIIDPLKYSSYDIFNDKEVKLKVNFNTNRWTIINYFSFDINKKIKLINNSGACLELVVYTYDRIYDLLSSGYIIEFAETIESSTFNNPNSTHWILLITDRNDRRAKYILDPSFKRYGRIEDFDDYRIYNTSEAIPASVVSGRNNRLDVANGAPIFMKDGNLIGLNASPVNGKFDDQNFSLGIYAKKPFKYKSHYIYNIGRSGGQFFEREDRDNIEEYLGPKEFKNLKSTLNKLYQSVEKDEFN
jgi:hypothetical protein